MTLRQILRIGRWEFGRSVGRTDRTVLIVLLVALVGVAVGGVTVADRIGSADAGIYRVSVDAGSPYHAVAQADPRFRPISGAASFGGSDGVELAVRDGRIVHERSRIGSAALSAFREAIVAYNDRELEAEPDQAAAFPVSVELRYRDRSDLSTGGPGDPGPGDTDGGNASAGTDGGTGDGGGGIGSFLDGLRSSGRALFGAGQSGTPADITPPFPMRSLLVAFAFLVPLNPIAQAFGSSVMTERIRRRGESLLVSPVRPSTIVAGKTVPYATVAVGIVAAIAVLIGGSWITILAVLPIVAVFLGATFLAALFARSFTELSFLTLTISVVVTAYAFIPAIFTDVHPVAGISPLAIVVRDLSGTPVDASGVAFATVPLAIVSIVLFGTGINIYREEDLFTQRTPADKLLDALAARLTTRRVPLWSALTLPFVFVAELFAIAILFIAPSGLAIPALLAAIATIEEVAKSLPVLAGFERDRFPRSWRHAVLVGIGSGFGFAVGEKAFLAAQLAGLPNAELGQLAFTPLPSADPILVIVLVLAPILLHLLTATISAIGASFSGRHYLLGLGGAVLVHLVYNVTVVVAYV